MAGPGLAQVINELAAPRREDTLSGFRGDRPAEPLGAIGPLSIAAAQPNCTPHNIEQNALHHARLIRAAEARVVVFPELSLTGYEPDVPIVEPDDPGLEPLVEACAETRSIALVGAPIRDADSQEYIATLEIDRCGVGVAYRKMVLHGCEAERFSSGGSPALLLVDGWRLGLAICKDTAGATHAATTAELGMDVYVASVIEHLDDAARTNERARRVATGHRVWAVTASFAGATGPFRPAGGGSSIVSPHGSVIAQATDEPGVLIRGVLETRVDA
jgi:predicted amidohydrolase